jgi:hypothetical protein
MNSSAAEQLTEGEQADVHEALGRVEARGKIGDMALRRRVYAIVRRLTGMQLPDFDSESNLIRDQELVNPFRKPEEGDEIAQAVGAPRATGNGAMDRECRDLVNRRYERYKDYFGIKDERIQDIFYHLIEGTVTTDEDTWMRWILDCQEEYVGKIEEYNGRTPFGDRMRQWIGAERDRLNGAASPAESGKRKVTGGEPAPWPSQADRPPTGPAPEGAHLVCAGTERFQ